MPRAQPLALLLLAAAAAASAADVFVIADSANQTLAVAENAKEAIAEANDVVLANNDTISEADHDPVVRKKRTFGDVVFRGLADVLGYNVARKTPQVVFPPPLAPVPGIDTPLRVNLPRADAALQTIPVALVPIVQAAQAAQAAQATPCGRAASPQPCQPQAKAPQPKPAPPPCPKPRAVPRPKPKPKPKPQPPPCGSGRANPTTPSPCAPSAPAAGAPKSDSNLETITSNFRLDFNFNRAPATASPAASDAVETQQAEQEQEQLVPVAPVAPVAIRPQAGKLPPEPPRNPRVYLDAFVVQNGVPKKVQTIDVLHLNQHQADNDYLVYDEDEPVQDEAPQQEAPQQEAPQQEINDMDWTTITSTFRSQILNDDDYDYVQESTDRTKLLKQLRKTTDRSWGKKKNKKTKLPSYDYRYVHFGDRDLANQLRDGNEVTHQSLKTKEQVSSTQRQPFPATDEEEGEVTTTTQDPRRRLKPRILPPTEHNPNQIDTITVRVPPIYKDKRPKKLHREQPERPDREEESEYKPYEYTYYDPQQQFHGSQEGYHAPQEQYHGPQEQYHGPQEQYHGPEQYRAAQEQGHGHEERRPVSGEGYHGPQEGPPSYDTASENSESTYQTEKPKRKRRRKTKRKTRSVPKVRYTAGDFDYYGNKLPISKEEEYFRGLTIPPPTQDADLARLEQGHESDGHFLDDHERLRDDPERIKNKPRNRGKKNPDDKEGEEEPERSEESERLTDSERSSESERSDEKERSQEDAEKSGEKERADETERSERLSPNARVRETGYRNNFVRAHNVQVDDAQPLVRTVKRKKPRADKRA